MKWLHMLMLTLFFFHTDLINLAFHYLFYRANIYWKLLKFYEIKKKKRKKEAKLEIFYNI